jgi:hypothetical protein
MIDDAQIIVWHHHHNKTDPTPYLLYTNPVLLWQHHRFMAFHHQRCQSPAHVNRLARLYQSIHHLINPILTNNWLPPLQLQQMARMKTVAAA